MTIDPTQLLRQLEPAVRPVYASAPLHAGRAPFEGKTFDQLLAEARGGEVTSGRAVEVAYEPAVPFTEGQLDRVNGSADLAEASGAKRALVLLDGRGLVLDVATRRLTGELDTGARVAQLDAAVLAPAAEPQARALGPPGGVAPRAVGEALLRVAQRLPDSSTDHPTDIAPTAT